MAWWNVATALLKPHLLLWFNNHNTELKPYL